MKLRKIVSVVLLVSTLFGGVLSAEAATYGKATSSGNYNTSAGKKVEGTHTHYIYKNSYNWISYYPGKNLTPITYHVAGHGADELTYSTS